VALRRNRGGHLLHFCGPAVAFRLHRCTLVQSQDDAAGDVRGALDRVLGAWGEIDGRFAAGGGLGSVLDLYEQVRRELERVSYDELDRVSREIRTVVEALLQMDYDLRKIRNLKAALESREPSGGGAG
jgi:hypothetical protein